MDISDYFNRRGGMQTKISAFLCIVFFQAAGCAVPTELAGKHRLAKLQKHADSWTRHSEKWLNATGESGAQPDIVHMRKTYRLDIDSQGRARWEVYHVFMPLTETGVASSGMLHAYWSPWNEKRPLVSAHVLDPQGRIRSLDPNMIEEGSASHDSEGISSGRRLRAPLPGVREGSVIQYRIIQEQHRTINRRGDSHTVFLAPTTPVLETTITITAPADKYLKHQIIGMNVNPVSQVVRKGRRKIVYKLGPMYKKLVEEPHLPPDVVDNPMLVVSTAPTWNDAAESLRQRMERKIRPDQVRDIVRKILKQKGIDERDMDAGTTERLTAAFTEYIQQKVRYTGVWLDEGVIDPATPKVTLKRTFGDCKDMAVLLISMLRAAGRRAYPALVKAGTDTDVRPDTPGVSPFNHAIVKVIAEKPFWVDPTARWIPPGRLPLPCRQRWALVLKPEIKGLVRTPGLDIKEELYAESRRIHLAPLEGGKVVEITRAHGTTGEDLRSNAAYMGKAGFRKFMKSYFTNAYGVEKPDSVSHSRPEDLTKPFTIRLAGSNIRNAWTDTAKAVVGIDIQPLLFMLPSFLSSPPGKDSKHWKRKNDLWLSQPYSSHLHYEIIPPIGFEPDRHPEEGSISLGPAMLSWKSSLDKSSNKIQVDLYFTTGKELYTAAELKQFWRSFEAIKQNPLDFQVVYKHKSQKFLDVGNFPTALDLHKKLIEKYPGQSIHRTRLVNDLVNLGFAGDAIEHARLNVKLFPENDEVRHILAWALKHNEFGTRYGIGYKREESLTEYHKVLKMNPGRSAALIALVDVLLKNRIGLPNSDPADLDAAIEQMVILKNEHDYSEHDETLLQTLFRRGRYSEIERWAKKMKGSEKNEISAYRVAATAVAQGTKHGAELALELGGNREETHKITLRAAIFMVTKGHYPRASQLLEPIAGKMNMEAELKLWQKMKRFSPSEKTSTEIDDFIRNQLYFLLTGRWNEKRLDESLAPESSERMRDTFRMFSTGLISNLIQQSRNLGASFFPEFLADLMMVNSRIRHEGDERTGWLSRIYIFDKLMFSFYSVRTPAGLRLRSLAACRSENGRIVDNHLRKGNLKAAQMILDLMAENEDSSSDPFSGTAFSHVWTSSAGRDQLTMGLAGATLMAQSAEYSSHAIKRLLYLKTRIRQPHLRLQLDRALAQAYTKDKKHKQALKLYQRLHADSPRAAGPFHGLCRNLSALKRYNAVVKLTEQRLKEEPKDWYAYFLLVDHFGRKKDFPAALKAATQWIERGDPNPAAYLLRSFVYASMGKKYYEKALADIKSAERMDASSELFLRTTGLAYVEMERLDLAAGNFEKILNSKPGRKPNSNDFYFRGRIAEAAGLIDTAIRSMEKVEPDDREEASTYYDEAQQALKNLRKIADSIRSDVSQNP